MLDGGVDLSARDEGLLEARRAHELAVTAAAIAALTCLGCGSSGLRCPACDAHLFRTGIARHAETCGALRAQVAAGAP